MKNILFIRRFAAVALVVLSLASAAFGQTYIQNVTVVDVENRKLIPGQTVVVKDGIISEIAPANKITPPAKAFKINGAGKFLMPGMTDSHVHFFQSGGLYARPDAIDLRKYQPYEKEIKWTHENMEDFLRRYLKAGITSVIDVGATYNFLELRKKFADKDFAPNVYMTGPLLTTTVPAPYKDLKNDSPFILVTSVEDAKRAIAEQLPYKPDFIKVWYIVDSKNVEESAKKFEPVFKAIVEESRKNNLKVAVHATQKITAEIAVRNGADFLVHSVDDGHVSDEFVQMMKAKGTVLSPTLTVYHGYADTFGQKTKFSFYELTNANPFQIGTITDLKHIPEAPLIGGYKTAVNSAAYSERQKNQDATMRANLKKLADAGVTIAAGTDAGNIG
ncbi:MAG TPA: amidohydrolase family protein, partial [Pyrinomonadaceae bacterium]|nr:amidohydrolase family protein [Pyrinomonadaceae bacterium]